MMKKGHVEAAADSILETKKVSQVYIHTGPVYRWVKLLVPDSCPLPTLLADKVEDLKSKPISPQETEGILQEILTHFDNNGYPFAKVKLGNILLKDSVAEALLFIDRYNQILFDSIAFAGEKVVSKEFLIQYLGIKPGKPYNESLVLDAERKLNELAFLKNNRSPVVFFKENKATLVLYLEKNKASNFDGIVGLAPASELTPGKLLLTGEAHLLLQNLFGKAYAFQLDYRNFRGSSQDVFLQATLPYLFKTQLGADVSQQLLKYDTNFFSSNSELGLRYQFNGNDYLKAFYRREAVNLLQFDTVAVLQFKTLPEFIDQSNNIYGLNLKRNRLNYRPNPTRGYSLDLVASAGLKHILENSYLKTLGLYDTLKLNNLQYRLQANGKLCIPLGKSSTLFTQFSGSHLASPSIFANELYRIGGIRTLRGYDEQSILASTYLIGNVEYRYIIDRNSHAALFLNGAWWENHSRGLYKNGLPLGAGVGVNLQTKAGILSLYYALPFSPGKQFEFRTGKVHFGVVNYF